VPFLVILTSLNLLYLSPATPIYPQQLLGLVITSRQPEKGKPFTQPL
jgi:hypothetical protein